MNADLVLLIYPFVSSDLVERATFSLVFGEEIMQRSLSFLLEIQRIHAHPKTHTLSLNNLTKGYEFLTN